jgi:hypothetical protein
LDAKDVRIFCEIAFKGLDYDSLTDRRVSPLAIARKLGLDEKTVRMGRKDGGGRIYQILSGYAQSGTFSTKKY